MLIYKFCSICISISVPNVILYYSLKGLLFANGEAVPTTNHLLKLYVHEATRVYSDKLIDSEDKQLFQQLLRESLRKNIAVSRV